MGWYDDEEKTRWPEWATPPLAWIGCLMAAVLPAGVLLAAWNAVLPEASAATVRTRSSSCISHPSPVGLRRANRRQSRFGPDRRRGFPE